MNVTKNPGIYIHVPFCQVKCGYCDFYSDTTLRLKEQFLTSLITEIRHYKKIYAPVPAFDSLYIGGGTPSVLEAAELTQILNFITDNFDFMPDSEITIEINPGTVDYSTLDHLYRAGFTRLSIGVQSFNDHELRTLGRIHTVEQAKCCILDSREAGFNSINIDLISALPEQSLDQWLQSLDTVVQFAPEHISAYNLIYEENTPFYEKLMAGEFSRLSNDAEAAFLIETESLLARAGYMHYEISNYANSEYNVSRHNYKYWNHTPYLSFGPSAHSFWNNKRWSNVRSTKQYIDLLDQGHLPVDFEETIDKRKLSDEFFMLRLRTINGIDVNEFFQIFNINFMHTYAAIIEKLIKENFARIENDHFRLTHKGLLVCDEISPMFTR